ncbi:hypothetical protein [Schleiferilactobacillus perolens]|nr:hypothetical protein [Schleiferilactobacillus perolens]
MNTSIMAVVGKDGLGESNPQTASIVVCTSKPLNIWEECFGSWKEMKEG